MNGNSDGSGDIDISTSLLEFANTISRECIECDAPFCYKKNPAKKCSRCCTSYYCDRKCQKKDWKEHKQKCDDVKEVRNRISGLGNDADEYREREAMNAHCLICECECECECDQGLTALNDCGHAFCVQCLHKWYSRNLPRKYSESDFMEQCPICQHKMELSVWEQISRRAYYYERLGDSFQNPLSKQDQRRFGRMALAENEKMIRIVGSENEHSTTRKGLFMSKARILDNLGQYDDAIRILDECCDCDGSENENENETDNPDAFELAMMKGQIYQNSSQWDRALELYEGNLLPTLEDTLENGWDIFRIVCRIARVRYKKDDFEECIRNCDIALAYHRHVDEIYEYKAFSYKALGDLEKAIETMNKAVLYETPGDDRNTTRLVKIYQELCALRNI